MPHRTPYLRLQLFAVLSAWIGDAAALGLGELRTRSHLGEPLVAEMDVLTTGKEVIDASCFRLRTPQGDGDLPWLRKGSFELRRGPKTVVEIRSHAPLREPILQVGVAVGCGHEVQRDYTLLLSPRSGESALAAPPAPPVVRPPEPEAPAAGRRQPPPSAAGEAPPAPPPRRPAKRAKPPKLPDRLVLSGFGDAVGEPSLRLATELSTRMEGASGVGEAQRELLRLEYRLLAAMNEQATSQLAAAEKLRSMEATLAEMQQRTGESAARIESADAAPAAAPVAPSAETAPPAPPPASAPAPATRTEPAPAQPTWFSEWGFYGAMLGALLGIGGWLGWRQYRERRELRDELAEPIPEAFLDPLQPAGAETPAEVDFSVGAQVAEAPTPVDVPQDADQAGQTPPLPEGAAVAARGPVAPSSIAGATVVDEHFEVNPVMELAEIMLSFGRVKGAAQALQEYIDQNPEEALQPWIRLMDVYRMAGMREEFDRLAQDLNQHFNVEVQRWDGGPAANPLDKPLEFVLEGAAEPPPDAAPKAMSIEDMEHIRGKLIACWGSSESLDYLNQLLRDNRGGKRSGFTLPVVEEILFLVELLHTRNAMESEEVK